MHVYADLLASAHRNHQQAALFRQMMKQRADGRTSAETAVVRCTWDRDLRTERMEKIQRSR